MKHLFPKVQLHVLQSWSQYFDSPHSSWLIPWILLCIYLFFAVMLWIMGIIWTVNKTDCELPWLSLEVRVIFVFSTTLLALLFYLKKVCVWNKGKDTPVIDTSTLAHLLKVLCIILRILLLRKLIKILFVITCTTRHFDVLNFFLWNYMKKRTDSGFSSIASIHLQSASLCGFAMYRSCGGADMGALSRMLMKSL